MQLSLVVAPTLLQMQSGTRRRPKKIGYTIMALVLILAETGHVLIINELKWMLHSCIQ